MKPNIHYLVLSDGTLDVRFEDGTSAIMTYQQLNNIRDQYNIISGEVSTTKTKEQILVESAFQDLAKQNIVPKYEKQTFTLTCAAPERYYKFYGQLKEDLILYSNLNLPRASFKFALNVLIDKWLKATKIPVVYECPRQGGPTLGSDKFTTGEIVRINDLCEKLGIKGFKHLVCTLTELEDYKIQDAVRYAILHRKELIK